jgi:hypothetical protein
VAGVVQTFPSSETVARKKRYLLEAYSDARAAYGQLVSSLVRDELSESLVYSVLLYEQFNRPKWIRLAERLVFPLFSRSLGPMQVTTRVRISDWESVRLGTERLMQIYDSALIDGEEKAGAKGGHFDPVGNASHRRYMVYRVASGYNKDDGYLSDVQEMHEEVVALRYPALMFPSKHWVEYLF